MAPADEPPMAMRSGSMRYVDACERRNRTAVWASSRACPMAVTQRTMSAVPVQPPDASR